MKVNKNLKQADLTKKTLSISALAGTTLFAASCSTAEPGGRCTSFKDPKYVASSADTDGKKWTLAVTPDVADLKCDYDSLKGEPATTGIIAFTALVTDGQGFAKPALAISASFVGSSASAAGAGFVQNPDNDDNVATDACGLAQFKVKWTCPGPRKSIGGYFYVTSGPLTSKSVKVTLEHVVQDPPVGTVVTK